MMDNEENLQKIKHKIYWEKLRFNIQHIKTFFRSFQITRCLIEEQGKILDKLQLFLFSTAFCPEIMRISNLNFIFWNYILFFRFLTVLYFCILYFYFIFLLLIYVHLNLTYVVYAIFLLLTFFMFGLVGFTN